MALVKCSECGKEVSSNADKCPNCGHRPTSAIAMAAAVLGGVFLLVLIVGLFRGANRQAAPTLNIEAAIREGVQERQTWLKTENVEWQDGAFTGVVRNSAALPVYGVKVAVEFTDDDGAVVERSGDSIRALGGGETWRFHTGPPPRAWKHAKVTKVSCD